MRASLNNWGVPRHAPNFSSNDELLLKLFCIRRLLVAQVSRGQPSNRMIEADRNDILALSKMQVDCSDAAALIQLTHCLSL